MTGMRQGNDSSGRVIAGGKLYVVIEFDIPMRPSALSSQDERVDHSLGIFRSRCVMNESWLIILER